MENFYLQYLSSDLNLYMCNFLFFSLSFGRSKRKLLGRKDSFDNKQGDFSTNTLGGVSKSSYQNDNFMALLRRTRSAKASCGSRISAAELLRSSKPAASGGTELTGYKKHNIMQSHGP